MTDKQMLELAAKAAGIEHLGGEHSIANDGRLWDCNGLRWWNPLTDDGDALRLAVKLGITDLSMAVGKLALAEDTHLTGVAVVRRAITRAAAEIGRAL